MKKCKDKNLSCLPDDYSQILIRAWLWKVSVTLQYQTLTEVWICLPFNLNIPIYFTINQITCRKFRPSGCQETRFCTALQLKLREVP